MRWTCQLEKWEELFKERKGSMQGMGRDGMAGSGQSRLGKVAPRGLGTWLRTGPWKLFMCNHIKSIHPVSAKAVDVNHL